VKDAFEPDYVLIQCGVDGLAGDPCAIWNWSLAAAEGSLGWCIARIVNEWGGKKLFLGGGILLKLHNDVTDSVSLLTCRRL
jgi:histone deacetylase 8